MPGTITCLIANKNSLVIQGQPETTVKFNFLLQFYQNRLSLIQQCQLLYEGLWENHT